MTTSTLLIAVVLLALAGGVFGWWQWRRLAGRDAAGIVAAGGRTAGSDLREAAPGDAGAAQAGGDIRELFARLHAIAFDDAPPVPEGRPGKEHAPVIAAAGALLARIETQPRYAPRRPQLLPQLMQAVNDAESSGKAIAAIIGQDPALAGNLLRLANSALYRVQSLPVENIERAVALVGTDGIRQLIAVALMQPVMQVGDGAFGRCPAVIWEHTLLAAAAAAEHARRIEHGDAFAAQMLGLLHGLGAIIVVQVLRDEYARRPELAPDPGVAAALLDQWAAPTARRVAQGWELSARIAQALDDQQRPDAPGELTPLGRSLRFGRAAGALAMLHRHGRIEEAEAQAWLARLDSRHEAVSRIWERISRSGEG